MPVVGICFGHQIIAQALGGKVEKFDGGWSVGATEYKMDGKTLTLNAWHQDQVTRLPEGATRIARATCCENAVLAYGAWEWQQSPKGLIPTGAFSGAPSGHHVDEDDD